MVLGASPDVKALTLQSAPSERHGIRTSRRTPWLEEAAAGADGLQDGGEQGSQRCAAPETPWASDTSKHSPSGSELRFIFHFSPWIMTTG